MVNSQKNTPASKALSTLSKQGLTGYSQNKNKSVQTKVAIKVKQLKSVKNDINHLTLAA